MICGGIDVEAHMITRGDVNIESTDPAPTTVQDLENGNKEYVWNLSQVDNQGQKVQLNLLFKDLTEGERRAAATEAFLVFNNSFAADEPVQVPLTIPTLLATRQMQIVPTLSEERYGAEAPVEIQVEVINDSDTDFNGTLELTIVDSDDKPVAQLPPIAVTDLTGPASAPYNAQWNTTTTYAGTYKLVSRLVNPDRTYDEAERLFEIFHPETNALLSLKTTLDKDSYHSSEAIVIHQRVESLSSNTLVDDALITITITDPSGQVIHTESQALGQLPPNGIKEIRMPYMLNQAEKGTYTVNVVVADSDTQLANQTTEFAVENDLNLAVTGQVKTLEERLTTEQTQTCTQTLINEGTTDLTELPIKVLLMDLDTLGTVQTHTALLNLSQGSSQSFPLSFDNFNPTHTESHYACVLQAQLSGFWQTLDFENFTVTPATASECSTVYAIHDQDLNDSQLFSYDLNSQIIKPLGPVYWGRDLEGLDIAPDTSRLYASTGKPKSRLYEVDGDNGQITPIGDIGFNEVESLSFHPDGSLWGWAKGGLIRIDRDTGKGDLVYANNTNIEGLAWNNAGSLLYGTSSKGKKSTLWVYDGQTLEKACDKLSGEIESLEMRPDDKLIFGLHQQHDLSFHVYDIASCQIVSEARITTPYQDIEGIAWPIASCNAKQQALQGFLTALSSDKETYIGEDGHVHITISGQLHHGQLAQTTTQTTTTGGQLTLTAIPDANQDGISDFLITYPDGTQQILYYLGITEE